MKRVVGIKTGNPLLDSFCDWCREPIFIVELPFSNQQVVCGECVDKENNRLAHSLEDAEKAVSDAQWSLAPI